MTAVALDPGLGRTGALDRIVNAGRLHAANPWGTLILPWMIYGAIFGLTYLIWQLVVMGAGGVQNLEPEAFMYNGGGTWVLFYMMVVAVQAMNQTFKFALGLCITRREYYLGTAAYFLFLSLLYATGITLAGIVEKATGGWGVGGSFFIPFFLQDASLGEKWLIWVALFAVFFFLGAAVATVYVRWGSNGLITFFVVLALAIVATVWAIMRLELGDQLGSWFAARSLVDFAGLGFGVSAVAGLIGYGMMRRATPRA